VRPVKVIAMMLRIALDWRHRKALEAQEFRRKIDPELQAAADLGGGQCQVIVRYDEARLRLGVLNLNIHDLVASNIRICRRWFLSVKGTSNGKMRAEKTRPSPYRSVRPAHMSDLGLQVVRPHIVLGGGIPGAEHVSPGFIRSGRRR